MQASEKSSHPRQSNLELLRLVAMVMIIAHHFALHSGFEFSPEAVTVNRLWVQFLQIGGKLGVNLYVLISGYFLIEQPAFKTARALRLWAQVAFYSIALYLLFALTGLEPFGWKALIKHFAPITFHQWWFASTYFVLYLLTPYLNRLLKSLSQRQYLGLIVLLVVLWSVLPTFTKETLQSNPLLWFVALYAIAGYIRRYGLKTKLSGGALIALGALCLMLTYLATVVFDVLGVKMPFFRGYFTYFYDAQRLPMLVTAVVMFAGFSRLNLGCDPTINLISSTTFGIYLIHDNPHVRPFLWKTVLHNASYAGSRALIPHSLFVILVVFVACAMVEWARKALLERPCLKAFDRLAGGIDGKIHRWLSRKVPD